MPAVPSEVFVVSSGAFAAAGELHLAWAVAAAAVGAVAGDHVVFGLGRHKLPGALDRFRLGRRARMSVERVYDRFGSASAATIVAGRFLPLGRTASAASAGLAGLAPRRFLIWSVVGSLAWASWLVGLGYLTGSVTEAPLWMQSLIGIGVALVVGVWAGAIRAIIRTRRRLIDFADRNRPAAAPAAARAPQSVVTLR
nr:VTT domain-containing protein [Phytoactinopolyspora mesophila]